ncbi:aconitate hydratase, cytoplasmic-like [Sesbania bispinosa]|nr:aconitate hydratase, cytoplasmic-like [Sesbania bispinosa]
MEGEVRSGDGEVLASYMYEGIGAPQFEDMVNMTNQPCSLIEPRQYLIFHFFPSPPPQS